MADVLTRFKSGKIWDFKGGIHPPEMKSQSNQSPIKQSELAHDFYVPIKQHAGTAGNVLVKEGDYVLKGQPLTQGDGLRTLPVHAPTSGTIKFIGKHVAPHPSGLTEDMIHIQADGLDKWREQFPLEEFFTQPVEQLIDRIYQAGVAGLGGAVFPTAAKIQSAEKKVKLLIINGAECEPYITCDDRLMRDYTDEMIEGIRILRYILRPEKVVIAVEDNKPEAIQAIQQSLHGANDIELRIIPTKYPSGAAKQLIYLLTGMEVPSGGRSYDIGVLMHNVGTAFAIKRAVINDEPLIERVVTLTGDKILKKGNYWVRLGTPVDHLLAQVGYQYDERFPVFAGGPMMGLQLSDLNAPVTKLINCLLAPDHFEYGEPEPEQSCIRCSACSDACPVNLMPQQLYWYARSEDHQKSEKAKKAEEAKIRFEAKQARMEREEQERKARSQRAAEARREELAKQKGEDPVKAALERLKAKQAGSAANKETKTIVSEKGEILPDNHELMEQRKARRLSKQQAQTDTNTVTNATTSQTDEKEAKKAAVAAALARAKAKKAAAQGETVATNATESAVEKTDENPTALDPKKAAVAVAIARAKAKKAAAQGETVAINATESVVEKTDENPTVLDPKKAAIAATIARAKAKKAAAQSEAVTTNETESTVEKTDENSTALDPKKATVAAAIARAKAKKAAAQGETVATNATESVVEKTDENPTALDPKKAAIAAAIARAKAKKAAAEAAKETE